MEYGILFYLIFFIYMFIYLERFAYRNQIEIERYKIVVYTHMLHIS